jgi:hypothetical protein
MISRFCLHADHASGCVNRQAAVLESGGTFGNVSKLAENVENISFSAV